MVNGRLTALWQYRSFILSSVRREIQLKYQNSLLGAVWTILNPLSMIVIYTVIFSQVMQARLPNSDGYYAYSIYLCAGIIAWGLFSEVVLRLQNLFLEHANILKKLSFPRLSLPIIVVLTALLNFAIIAALFMIFLLWSGVLPGSTILFVIPILIIQLTFSIGLGISLAVLNVFFRDIGHLFTIIMQFWFWLTPIVYPVSILPEAIRTTLMIINPMAPIISAYQMIFVHAKQPDWITLVIPLIAGIVMMLVGLQLYLKHAHEIVDEL